MRRSKPSRRWTNACAKLIAAVDRQGGAVILTSDHGNSETMRDPATGGPHTAHTLNRVPVILVGGPPGAALRDGRLADVAPTLVALSGHSAAAGNDRPKPYRTKRRL